MIKVGSDFSGVGAFDSALIKLGIDYKTVYACDWDKYSRQTYIHNYGKPDYYPEDVYDREIPKEPLDIYMTSPPCQAFSLAGKRKGETDKRGILFYNSHEFIKKNKPRYFIFENVKGLLSDDGGKTFQRWIDYLGGKSVNGNPVIFPLDNSTPYHVYYQVLNAKHYGIPQNRERVFIVGIRDDVDNDFCFPKPFPLTKRLKDVLEDDVDEKYFLSDKMLDGLIPKSKDSGFINQDTQASQVHSKFKESPTLSAGTHGYANGYIQINSATKSGYEIATEEDSINFSVPNSETRRDRVGKGVAQTLDTACNQGVMIGAFRGRNPKDPSGRTTGAPMEQRLEINQNGTYNTLTSVQKDNVVVYGNLKGGKWDKTHEQSRRVYSPEGIGATLHTMSGGGQHPKIAVNDVIQLNQSKESGGKQPYQHNRVYADYGVMTTLDCDSGRKSVETNFRIRRLTVRECFRLMDFPDTFDFSVVSNSQAYKQAGNSICVGVLSEIIKKLNL